MVVIREDAFSYKANKEESKTTKVLTCVLYLGAIVGIFLYIATQTDLIQWCIGDDILNGLL